MQWHLYDKIPVPIAVYYQSNDTAKIVYENADFKANKLRHDFDELIPWLSTSTITLGSPLVPVDRFRQRAYARRKIEQHPGYWTLTADVATVNHAGNGPPPAPMSQVAHAINRHQTRLKYSFLCSEDDALNARIMSFIRKAEARSEEDAEHVKTTLEWAAREDRLGPITAWPETLWQHLMILFDCSFICAIYWGSESRIIYNYAYRPLTGTKHPNCIGLPAAHPDCWGDIWNSIKHPFEMTSSTGIVTRKTKDLLLMNKTGYAEECYFDWSIIPIDGPNGFQGLFNYAIDCTEDVLNDRRLNVLRNLTLLTSKASNFQDYYKGLMTAVEVLPEDFPFMLVYSCKDDLSAELVGSIAYLAQPGTQIPQRHMFEAETDSYLGQLLNVVYETQTAVICIDRNILNEFEYTQGWAEPCNTAVVAPIFAENQSKLLAIAVIGINPKKKLGMQYQRHLDLLFDQVAVGLSNIHHLQEQIAHVQKIADMETSRGRDLEIMLEQKSEELYQSQQQFVKMAEELPAGMYRLDAEGKVRYLNPKAIELTGGPAMYSDPEEPFLAVHPDWRPALKASWEDMVKYKRDLSYEVRCTTDREDGSERWVAGVINVDKDSNDEITGLTGFLVDTSERRRAEYLINKRADDAQESKRQQEAFIDMTSHELRNPLSAIVQSVDLVQAGLERILKTTALQEVYSIVEDELSTLSNVDLCAQHMRRIIDDTINISKIESNLLVITPDAVNLSHFFASTLGMFKAEAKMKNIELQLDISPEIQAQPRFMLDPARLSQILINLITNSIKFMSDYQGARVICVSAQLSNVPPFGDWQPKDAQVRSLSDRPSSAPESPKRQAAYSSPPDGGTPTRAPVSRPENPIYIVFSVRDTGPGMSSGESQALFRRFSQCTPKTHVKYGGSGLGLYICRKLAELQGGDIRCESAKNHGAKFTFFLPTEACEKPADVTSAPRIDKQLPQKHFDRSQLKTLVVEDNVLNQRILQKQLLKAGYQVAVANHGLECLEMIAKEDFDVILLDREMPICDGLECITRLRESERPHETKPRKRARDTRKFVIAISANARAEQVQEMLVAGADKYLTKPFRFPDLDQMIYEHFM